MKLKSVEKVDVKGKRVLVRVDFNVPVKDGEVTDTTRIEAALPTIKYLIDHGAKVILMSHLGRPKGKDPSLTLKPVAKKLSEVLGKKVEFVEDCIGEAVKKKVDDMMNGDVLLLENLRFYSEEKKNDPEFSRKLSRLADVYVNDAFGTAHRAHASTYGVASLIEERAAGFLMVKEIEALSKLIENPERPFAIIIGGAKVSTKVPLIENFLGKVDKLIVGGGMIFTFYKSQGLDIGNSIYEEDMIEKAKDILSRAGTCDMDFLLPVDVMVAREVKEGTETMDVPREEIPDGWAGVDIGGNSRKIFASALDGVKTIFWNGPMGIFEIDDFAEGSRVIAEKVTHLTDKGVFTVVGGGDTIACLNKFNGRAAHVSTGGGASLEFLSGKKLPALEWLEEV